MQEFVWIGHFRGISGFTTATREYFKAILPYFENLKLASLEVLKDDDPLHEYRAELPLKETEIKIVNHLPTTDPTAQAFLSVWEFDHIPERWVRIFNQADVIMTQSTFCRDVFAKQIDDPSKIHLAPYIIPSHFKPDGSALRYFPDDKCVFGSVFDWVPRKVPGRTIQAFTQEFSEEEDARLVMRTSYPHGVELSEIKNTINKDSRITIIEEKIPDIDSFYRGIDVYISATAGEGWGQTLTEAMVSGVPTIASRHSGNLDFMNDENSFLVEVHDWSPVPDSTDFKWKLPKINSIKKRMREVYSLWEQNGGDTSKLDRVQNALKLKDQLTRKKIGEKIADLLHETFD